MEKVSLSAFAHDRERYLQLIQQMQPSVYEVPSQYFRLAKGTKAEYISEKPIPLSECKLAERFTGFDGVMETGAQIFFIQPGQENFFRAEEKRRKEAFSVPGQEDTSRLAFIQDMLAQGVLKHENAERNIRPLDFASKTVAEDHASHQFAQWVKRIEKEKTSAIEIPADRAQAVTLLMAKEAEEKAALDKLSQNSHDPACKREWLGLCQRNLALVTAFVRQHGWPSEKKDGLAVETAAFLMVQHADGNMACAPNALAETTQKQLALLTVMQQEAKPAFTAFVTDRVLRNSGQPQRYGTQLTPAEHAGEIEDPAHLDARRAQMGLTETEAQYRARMEQGDCMPFRPIIAQDGALLAQFGRGVSLPSPQSSKTIFKDKVAQRGVSQAVTGQ